MSTDKAHNAMWVAVMVLLGAGAWARADALKVGNRMIRDVKMVGVREGKLYYKTAQGQDRSVVLQEVQALEMDKYPDLAKGNEAFSKGDFAAAAKSLTAVVDGAKEDYVKVLAGMQLVAALDREGRFLEAARRYAALLALDNGPLVQAAKPQNLPAEEAARTKAAESLGNDLKTTKDPVAREFLAKAVEQLKSGEGAPAPTPAADGAPAPRAGLLNTAAENAKDQVDLLIEQGKAEQALAMVEQSLKGTGGSVSKLLYQRGRAQAAMGKDDDALVSFMRVVIHYSPKTCANYDKALVEAGKVFVKKGQPKFARQVWEEALALYDPDSAQAKTVDVMIKELKE